MPTFFCTLSVSLVAAGFTSSSLFFPVMHAAPSDDDDLSNEPLDYYPVLAVCNHQLVWASLSNICLPISERMPRYLLVRRLAFSSAPFVASVTCPRVLIRNVFSFRHVNKFGDGMVFQRTYC
jgi:hypothetical protein